MGMMTEYEAKSLIWQIDGIQAYKANGYVELTDAEDMLDVTLYYRTTEDSPKQRIDATFKLHRSSTVKATEPVNEYIYRE